MLGFSEGLRWEEEDSAIAGPGRREENCDRKFTMQGRRRRDEQGREDRTLSGPLDSGASGSGTLPRKFGITGAEGVEARGSSGCGSSSSSGSRKSSSWGVAEEAMALWEAHRAAREEQKTPGERRETLHRRR